MRGRFLASTSSMIVLGFALALATATLAAAAAPSNLNVTAMPGNEAEDAIAVNPTNPSNVVAMSTLPDVVAGLAVGVSFDGGQTWARHVIGTAGDPLGEICCDQQLAWDRFGNLWMTYLVNTNATSSWRFPPTAVARSRRLRTSRPSSVTNPRSRSGRTASGSALRAPPETRSRHSGHQ